MKMKEKNHRSEIIKVKDEKNFFQVIEERMAQEGFKCVETFPSLSSKSPFVNAGC